MAAVGLSGRDRIAVGEQDRELRLVRVHPNPILAEHVGAVGEEGDPAEALRFALGAEHPVRRI
jgi:hypothetical protein